MLLDFKDHFGLSEDLHLPIAGEFPMEKALSKIFDIMIAAMGEEKRNQLLDEVDAYSKPTPQIIIPNEEVKLHIMGDLKKK